MGVIYRMISRSLLGDAVDSQSQSLGQYLRRVRETQGFSSPEIAGSKESWSLVFVFLSGFRSIAVLAAVLALLVTLAGCSPAATPPAARAANATAEPLVFSGEGNKVAGPFPLRSGMVRAAFVYSGSHMGARNFIVKLMDMQGKLAGGSPEGVDSVLANATGDGSSEKAIRLEKAGSYVMDITAGGPWTITITQ